MRHFIAIVAAVVLTATICAEDAKDAADHRAEGIKALRESQTDQKAIVTAAKHFGRAAAIYEKLGEKDAAVEANSFLYWCKKKMTLADIEAFAKSGEVEVSRQLVKLDEVKVEKTDAQVWFDRAEKFAAANPDEHLLIAIRFFEVADRFKDSDPGRAAMDRSLKEMQLIAAAPAKKPEPPQPSTRPAVETPVKVPVPDAAKIKDAEKSIKDIFKEEYAKRGVDDKKALGAKLLQQGSETKDDPVSRYVLLKEAAANAGAGGDAETAVKALDVLGQGYEVDAAALKAEALGKILPANADAAKTLARMYLKVIDEAVAADSYDTAVKLVTAADAAARKAQDMPLVTQLAARGKEVRALQADFAKVKTAQATLKDKPDDPEANLAVGKFLCFSKNQWDVGLSLLAKSSDAKLKTLAEKELAKPTEADAQLSIADEWWELSEKSQTVQMPAELRAKYWYEKVYPSQTGLNRGKIERRLFSRKLVGEFASYFDLQNFSVDHLNPKLGENVIDELSAVRNGNTITISGTNKNDAVTYRNVFYAHNGKAAVLKEPMLLGELSRVSFKFTSKFEMIPDNRWVVVFIIANDPTYKPKALSILAFDPKKEYTISFKVADGKLQVFKNDEVIGSFDAGAKGRIGIGAVTRYRGNTMDISISPVYTFAK